MNINLHEHHHDHSVVIEHSNEHTDRRFDRLERILMTILRNERNITMTLEEIQAKVQENTDVQAGAIVLLGQLSDLIRAAGNDPVKLAAIADGLDSNKAALAAAVVANTPAADP